MKGEQDTRNEKKEEWRRRRRGRRVGGRGERAIICRQAERERGRKEGR